MNATTATTRRRDNGPGGLVASSRCRSCRVLSLVIATLALHLGCASEPPRDFTPAAARAKEAALLLEQGRFRKANGDDVAREAARALEEAAAPGSERLLLAWLRARLEPDRAARRGALEAVAHDAAEARAPVAGALVDLGDLDFEDGRPRAARARWEAALDPGGDPAADVARPRAAGAGTARILARLAWLDRGLLAEPGQGEAIAGALAHARARSAARAALRAAVDAWALERPRLPDAFIAAAHLALGERAEAEALLAEVAAAGLDSPVALALAGEARLEAGDPAGASRAFERALLLGPPSVVDRASYVRATVPRLVADVAAGRPVEAEELALLAAGRHPEVRIFALASVVAALEGGDAARARARLEAAFAAAPASRAGLARAARVLAFLLARAGHGEAGELLAQAAGRP